MGSVRVLGEEHAAAALDLCAADPVVNLFVAQRIRRFGLSRARLGCEVLGMVDGDRVLSLVHVGANLVPVGVRPDMVRAYVDKLGPYRGSNSIMGPSRQVLALFEALGERWGRSWRRARDVRPRQPLMELRAEPAVAPDPRVERVGPADFDSYYAASVRMYTEEVGVSPVGPDNSYATHVRRTIDEGRAFGIRQPGDGGARIVYKSDVGSWLGHVCQIQGVWLDPTLRGRGLAAPAMAGVARLARETTPIVSLYVNDFNAPAVATYRRVGFVQTDEFATVLY